MTSIQSFGALLKRERELRGISLEEISQGTYIRREFLEAIEQNQLQKIPGLTFLKGFVKSYVAYVGLDNEEVQLELKAFLREVDKQPHPAEKNLRTKRLRLGLFAFLLLFLLLFSLRIFL